MGTTRPWRGHSQPDSAARRWPPGSIHTVGKRDESASVHLSPGSEYVARHAPWPPVLSGSASMRGQIRGRADRGLWAPTVTTVELAWSAADPGDSPKGRLHTWRRGSPTVAQMARAGGRSRPRAPWHPGLRGRISETTHLAAHCPATVMEVIAHDLWAAQPRPRFARRMRNR